MTSSDFSQYLVPGKKGHLVGIGGVSMAPLAEVLLGAGLEITGSDISECPSVQHLRSLGIPVTIGHYAENVAGAEFVVRTAAVHDDNPEIVAAHQAGIPVFERAQAWGAIMRGYPNALCICGTHGKTTTTSMATHIFLAADRDPTVMIGGTLPVLSAGHRIGHGDTIIAESCEYYNSFHNFCPTVAVVLNIEEDHLDFFKNLEEIKASFRYFANLVPEDGFIIANADDPNTMDALAPLQRPLVTFGLEHTADVMAKNVHSGEQPGTTVFDLVYKGKALTSITLRVPGPHNIKNALAASAAALVLDVSPEDIAAGLASFTGAKRRFEYKGSFNGAAIYDDYAHHPSELHALLTMVKSLGYKRVLCVFQPHTFTRTAALFDDFVRELSIPDVALLSDIYAARENNTIGISSRDLCAKIPGSCYCPSFPEMEQVLRRIAQPGDIILTVGAGDIYKVGEALAEQK